jgi:hypothetical protein
MKRPLRALALASASGLALSGPGTPALGSRSSRPRFAPVRQKQYVLLLWQAALGDRVARTTTGNGQPLSARTYQASRAPGTPALQQESGETGAEHDNG